MNFRQIVKNKYLQNMYKISSLDHWTDKPDNGHEAGRKIPPELQNIHSKIHSFK